jgi:hypothetical protein
MLPASTRPLLLAGVNRRPFTIVLAGANYTRQHANFCVSVQIVFGLVNALVQALLLARTM